MRGIVIGNKSDGNVFCLPHGPCQTTLLEKTFFFFGFLSLYFGLSLCKHTEFTVPCDCRLMGQMNGRTDLFNGVWSQRWSRQRQHNAHKAHPSRTASSLERQPDSVLHIYSLLAPSSVLHSSPIYFLSFFLRCRIYFCNEIYFTTLFFVPLPIRYFYVWHRMANVIV